MGKMFDYPDRVATEVIPDLDYLIITNGAEEYNIKITELFNVHLAQTSHDHSQFTIESQVRDFAQQEATVISNNSITAHQTTWDHDAFVDSLEAGNIADTHIAAYLPLNLSNLQNGDVLIYNENNDNWENSAAPSSTVETLNDLEDVNLQSPHNKETLIYNESLHKWENGNVAINDIGGINIVYNTLDDWQTLIYSQSTGWTNFDSGYTGTFIDNDNNTVHVENGLIILVQPAEVWWDYTEDSGISGQYGTGWYDGSNSNSPQPGWTFEESS